MLQTRLILTLLALSGAALAQGAGPAIRVPGGSYSQITPQALQAQLRGKDFILINVHVPYEGELLDTDLFVPFDQVQGSARLPRAKTTKLVIYCRSGRMSALAARALVRQGYTNVRELRGGMDAWRAAGFGLKVAAARSAAPAGGRP
ncbi:MULTISPECIES: rhodanese-like domain-containing protein [Deinococcus]|uniref:Rhodanese-like domain-containing protein n=1 Tax=Deinococcus rufus TaxID=2136097 RepID=A0ABV7Z9Z9_9DEIO|nr:rhodanese-like domain-containing protein [Deinococcus sp. AB2017081]WQE97248.1 rhodanese-like domain-containing protein [Deinococcus sp. AB2017081]